MSSPNCHFSNPTDCPATYLADRLRDGDVAVVPTDTVYGLAASPSSFEAIDYLYQLKARPPELNIPVIIGHPKQLDSLGVAIGSEAMILAEKFWPGALTIVFGFAGGRRPSWLDNRVEVAVRLPDCQYLRSIAEHAGPLLVTSANRHGMPVSDLAKPAAESLDGLPNFVIDDGRLTTSPSTLVNTRVDPIKIEREGSISVDEISASLGVQVVLDA